jgi:hypothetical protein
MEDIHKINQININKSKTEFCFCCNNGIKIFDIENFEEKNSSDNYEFKLGDVSLSIFLEKDNILIFVGSKFNRDYPPNRVVFFDIKEKKEILSKDFEKTITNIKYVNKFLYLCFGQELKIYLNNNNKELEFKDEYTLCEDNKNLFEVWETKEENSFDTKIFLAYPHKNELIILFNTADDWKLGNKINIDSRVNKIQNLFYIKKLNQIFICDENAIYLYSFDVDDGSVKLCLKRGSYSGTLTSITLFNGNFLAINNLNKTIHIFDLDINNNAFSFSNIVYNLWYGIQEIYPCQRIYYKDLIQGKEGEYVQSDFNKKGVILVSEDESNILNAIAYNGYAYKIKVNLKENKYELVKKENYLKPNSNPLLKEGTIKNLILCATSSDSSNEKEKEEKKEKGEENKIELEEEKKEKEEKREEEEEENRIEIKEEKREEEEEENRIEIKEEKREEDDVEEEIRKINDL